MDFTFRKDIGNSFRDSSQNFVRNLSRIPLRISPGILSGIVFEILSQIIAAIISGISSGNSPKNFLKDSSSGFFRNSSRDFVSRITSGISSRLFFLQRLLQ